jgi:hypothetical protein
MFFFSIVDLIFFLDVGLALAGAVFAGAAELHWFNLVISFYY